MAMENKTADSSVVMALSELVRMEHDRIVSDREREQERMAEARAERERAQAAADEAERQRAERAADTARVAEAEARLRVEADRERDQRITAMRAELARVEAERQALRANLEHRAVPREPGRANGWALAFGLSSLVAASLAGLLVMQQGARDPLPAAPTVAPIVVVAPTVPDVAPVVAAPQPEVHEIAIAPTPPRRGHGTHTHVEHETTEHGTDLVGLDPDDGSDDVLGHLAEEAHRPVRH